MFCHHCGREIPDASQFCKCCGEMQRSTSPGAASRTEVGSSETLAVTRRPNAKAIIVAAAVVMAVVVVAAFFAFRGGGVGQIATGAIQQIVEPRTLEEWVAVNDPAFPSRLQSKLQTAPLANGSWSKIDVNVTGDTVIASYYCNDLDSSNQSVLDSTWMFLGTELGDYLFKRDEAIPAEIAQIEKNTGVTPINYLVEIRYRDGGLAYTLEYTAQGRTDDSWFKYLFGR